jgi:uncharacterized protein YbjT (DUF2867 family)
MSQTPAGKSVLVAGATGLVGRECVDLLLANPAFARIVALVRRALPTEIESERLKIEKVDFTRLEERPEVFNTEVIICALGTTMRQAGSEAAFRIVDFDYPLSIARAAFARGALHYLLVSSMGADPASGIFYNRVKGELEQAVSAIGYRSFTIIRPSLLIGERQERRGVGRVGTLLAVLTPARIRPVRATLVAESIVRAATDNAPGRRVIGNRDIVKGLPVDATELK